MESLRKNLSAYTLDDAPEDVRELYKDEFIQLYVTILFSALTRMFPKPTFAP